ncbi:unnamed protein product [Cylicocyclus nassatus]|uniref:CX domain-containing protein n=1 Tax=Cylicocyclus nassatus TaxID=53992 RepID=A0AA36M348_CYLNA|nr:unnamed protein product [Cylicocyclus nassatus]
MWNRGSILLLVILLANPVLPRRASAGGGSFQPRGSSGARGAIGQPGGGFQPGGASGFRPQPAQGGFGGGVHPQGGFHPNQGGFHPQGGFSGGFRPGTGPGSAASSGTFKKALIGGALGAVGGIVAFEAGKAIIQSATRPFNHDGRNYYFDNNAQVKGNEIMCSMPLSQLQQLNPTTTTTTAAPGSAGDSTVAPASTTPSPDQILNTLQFADGTRPKTITWTCKRGVEVCCGTDCCPAPVQNNMAGGNPNHAGSTGSNVAGIAIGMLANSLSTPYLLTQSSLLQTHGSVAVLNDQFFFFCFSHVAVVVSSRTNAADPPSMALYLKVINKKKYSKIPIHNNIQCNNIRLLKAIHKVTRLTRVIPPTRDIPSRVAAIHSKAILNHIHLNRPIEESFSRLEV